MCLLLSPVPWPLGRHDLLGHHDLSSAPLLTWLSEQSLPQCLGRPLTPDYDSTSVSLEEPQQNHTNLVLISNPIALSTIHHARTLRSDCIRDFEPGIIQNSPYPLLFPTCHSVACPSFASGDSSSRKPPWVSIDKMKDPSLEHTLPKLCPIRTHSPMLNLPICTPFCFLYTQCLTQSRYGLDKNVFKEWTDTGCTNNWRKKCWTQRWMNEDYYVLGTNSIMKQWNQNIRQSYGC